jgi:hypothetical protein
VAAVLVVQLLQEVVLVLPSLRHAPAMPIQDKV